MENTAFEMLPRLLLGVNPRTSVQDKVSPFSTTHTHTSAYGLSLFLIFLSLLCFLEIVVYKSLWICRVPSARERILACADFHKKPVYSIVQVAHRDEEEEEDEWFAIVLILFRARNRDLCLIQWLENQVDRRGQLVEDVIGMRRLVKGTFQVKGLTFRAFEGTSGAS